MDKRTLLAVVLSLAVLFGYQTFFVKPPVKTQPPTPQETTVASQTAAKPAAATSGKGLSAGRGDSARLDRPIGGRICRRRDGTGRRRGNPPLSGRIHHHGAPP